MTQSFYHTHRLNILMVIVILCSATIIAYVHSQNGIPIGGDDTKLYYQYGFAWLHKLALSAWYEQSILGTLMVGYAFIPISFVMGLYNNLLPRPFFFVDVCYFFSTIYGMYYFLGFFDKKTHFVRLIFGFLYAYISLSFKVYTTGLAVKWLMPTMPLLIILLVKSIVTPTKRHLIGLFAYSMLCSHVFFGIPWSLPYIPMGIILVIVIVKKITPQPPPLKNFACFALIPAANLFWMLPFISQLRFPSGGYIDSILNLGSFSATARVLSYKMLLLDSLVGLYSRSLVIEYGWPIKDIYLTVFLPLFALLLIYPISIFVAYAYSFANERIRYPWVIFILFLVYACMMTMNVPLLQKLIFYIGDRLPGFIMFRNFFDKFSPTYSFIFVLITYISAVKILDVLPVKWAKITYMCMLCIPTMVYMYPVFTNMYLSKPLWQTNNVDVTTKELDPEYRDFIQTVAKTIPHETRVLSLPLNVANYVFVCNEGCYIGPSPLSLFTHLDDVNGRLSINDDLIGKKLFNYRLRYNEIVHILQKLGIHYAIVHHNLPQELYTSYLFDQESLMLNKKINTHAALVKNSVNHKYSLIQLAHVPDTYQTIKLNTSTYHITVRKDAQNIPLPINYSKYWRLTKIERSAKNDLSTHIQKTDLGTVALQDIAPAQYILYFYPDRIMRILSIIGMSIGIIFLILTLRINRLL